MIFRRVVLPIATLVICVSLFAIESYAHPGRTDANNGHTDHSTGEYHYHHGRPAHGHYDIDGDGDIDCPYDFESTPKKSSAISGADISIDYKTTYNSGYSDGYDDGITWGEQERSAFIQTTSKELQAKLSDQKAVSISTGIIAAVIILCLSSKLNKQKQENEKLNSMLNLQREGHGKLKSDISKIIFLAERTAPEENKNAIRTFSEKYGTIPIDFPPDVYFTKGFIPVKGSVTEDRPFGDFTVYVSDTGRKYHVNRHCVPTSLRAIHIYKTGSHYYFCSRCAKFSDNHPPKWYLEIERIVKDHTGENLAMARSAPTPAMYHHVNSMSLQTPRQETQPAVVSQNKTAENIANKQQTISPPIPRPTGISFLDYRDSTLIVIFKNGSEYRNYDVPKSVYEAFKAAESKEAYYNEHIKGKYPRY